jgi:hypothetical protein
MPMRTIMLMQGIMVMRITGIITTMRIIITTTIIIITEDPCIAERKAEGPMLKAPWLKSVNKKTS